MAHVMKLKLGQVAPLHRHSTREMDATLERANINEELTHCNYTIGEPWEHGWQANIQQCIDIHNSNGRNLRSDAVVAASWVITQPQELPDEYRRDFFSACHDFLEARYGADHVDVGYVHLDESRAHMHTQVDMLNDATGRLQASKIVCRTDLQTFHADLERYCCERLGLERVGVELTKEQRGERELAYQDIKSWRAAKDELERSKAEAGQAKEQAVEAKAELAEAQQETKAELARSECLRRDNAGLEQRVGELGEQVERARAAEQGRDLGEQVRSLGHEAAEAIQRAGQGEGADPRGLAELGEARAAAAERVAGLEQRRDAAAARVPSLEGAHERRAEECREAESQEQKAGERLRSAEGRLSELRERLAERVSQLKERLGLDRAREAWQAMRERVGLAKADMGDAAHRVSAALRPEPPSLEDKMREYSEAYSARDWARYAEQDRGMER